MRDLVEDLHEFIDSYGLERPIVCGVSFGGVLALEYAARYPQAVEAVAVQGVGVRYERGLVQRIASLVLSGYPLPPNSPFVNQFFNLLFGTRQPRPVFEFVTRQCWQTDQSVMAHRLHLVERCDLGPELGRVNRARPAPWPGSATCSFRRRRWDDLTDGLPDGRGELLPQCGHLAFVTHPRLVAEKWREFIAALD